MAHSSEREADAHGQGQDCDDVPAEVRHPTGDIREVGGAQQRPSDLRPTDEHMTEAGQETDDSSRPHQPGSGIHVREPTHAGGAQKGSSPSMVNWQARELMRGSSAPSPCRGAWLNPVSETPFRLYPWTRDCAN